MIKILSFIFHIENIAIAKVPSAMNISLLIPKSRTSELYKDPF